MSARLMSAVFDSTLPAWLKPYAAALASFAAEDGSRVYPTVATLARMVGRSRRATQMAIQELRQYGVLHLQRGASRYHTNRYVFCAAGLPRASTDFSTARAPKPGRSGTFPQRPQIRGAVGFTPGVQWAAPDPSSDPSKAFQYLRARAQGHGGES